MIAEVIIVSFNSCRLRLRSCVAPPGIDSAFVEAYSGPFSADSFYALAVRRFDEQTVPTSLNGGSAVTLGAARPDIERASHLSELSGRLYTKCLCLFQDLGVWTIEPGVQYWSISRKLSPSAIGRREERRCLLCRSRGMEWQFRRSRGIGWGTSGGPQAAVQYPSPWSYSGPTANGATHARFFIVFGIYRNGRFGPSWAYLLVARKRSGGRITTTFPLRRIRWADRRGWRSPIYREWADFWLLRVREAARPGWPKSRNILPELRSRCWLDRRGRGCKTKAILLFHKQNTKNSLTPPAFLVIVNRFRKNASGRVLCDGCVGQPGQSSEAGRIPRPVASQAGQTSPRIGSHLAEGKGNRFASAPARSPPWRAMRAGTSETESAFRY